MAGGTRDYYRGSGGKFAGAANAKQVTRGRAGGFANASFRARVQASRANARPKSGPSRGRRVAGAAGRLGAKAGKRAARGGGRLVAGGAKAVVKSQTVQRLAVAGVVSVGATAVVRGSLGPRVTPNTRVFNDGSASVRVNLGAGGFSNVPGTPLSPGGRKISTYSPSMRAARPGR